MTAVTNENKVPVSAWPESNSRNTSTVAASLSTDTRNYEAMIDGRIGIDRLVGDYVHGLESRGTLGVIGGACTRFGYTTASLVPNAVGGTLSIVNTLGLSIKICARLCYMTCKDAGYVLSHGACDDNDAPLEAMQADTNALLENFQISTVAIGSIAYKVLLGIPTYIGSKTCPETTERIQAKALRQIVPCYTSQDGGELAGQSRYMKAVRLLSGAITFKYAAARAVAYDLNPPRVAPAPSVLLVDKIPNPDESAVSVSGVV